MPPHIHPDVAEIRRSPREGERISLVVVVREGRTKSVAEEIQRLDGEVTDTLPSEVLTVSLLETKLNALCENEDIRSISPDGELRILA
jgi:hypothetical protein